MPAEWKKCVKEVMASGKSEKAAYAICTAAFIKKHGRTPQSADKMSEHEDVFNELFASLTEEDLEELTVYHENELAELAEFSEDGESIRLLWSAPTKRKNIPDSHFFWPEKKKYPYRNPDGSVNCEGVLAAWRMANGARSGKKAPAKIIARIKKYRDRCLNKKASMDDLDGVEKYERKFEIPNKVCMTVSDAIKFSDSAWNYDNEKIVTIEVLRGGKFEHPVYGTITFDEKVFDNFTRNFDEGVPQEHIAYDFRHQPDWGAAAWVKKIFHKDNKLFATVELTRRGYRALKEKEFLYFSTEYHENYKDRETGKLYGPTILGGGLTNRPFIKGMAPILMSEDGEEVFVPVAEGNHTTRNTNNGNQEQKGEHGMLNKLKEGLEQLKTKIAALMDSDDGVQKKDLEEMNAAMATIQKSLDELKPEDLNDKEKGEEKLEELRERVVSLSERLGKIKVADAKADSKLEKLEKRIGTFEKALQDLDINEAKLLEEANKELMEKIKKLEEGNQVLGESLKRLQKRSEERDKELYVAKVEAFTKELQEKGFWPSVCEEVKAVLSADGASADVITLSEEEGEGDDKKTVEKKLSLKDVIERILSAIPEDARINLGEHTTSPTDQTQNKMLSVAEIEKMAEENKVSYSEMLLRLAEDPKYKHRIDI